MRPRTWWIDVVTKDFKKIDCDAFLVIAYHIKEWRELVMAAMFHKVDVEEKVV